MGVQSTLMASGPPPPPPRGPPPPRQQKSRAFDALRVVLYEQEHARMKRTKEVEDENERLRARIDFLEERLRQHFCKDCGAHARGWEVDDGLDNYDRCNECSIWCEQCQNDVESVDEFGNCHATCSFAAECEV